MIGKTLHGRYLIEEKLGSGGMSVVYRARDTLLKRPVTIKVLRGEFGSDEELVQRLEREAQAVAAVSHPNIVGVYDFGGEDGLHFMVMEYVEGCSLKEVIAERAPLPAAEAVDITIQVLKGLEYAHENQLVHRDIKPHNVLIGPKGQVKVTDFGLARPTSGGTVTYEGSLVGSVHYLAPEQARGEVTDARADIYAVGVVLYEMLTGVPPFTGDSAISVALKHVQELPRSPRELNPEVPPFLERIVLRALRKAPEQRFASATAMRQALEGIRAQLAAGPNGQTTWPGGEEEEHNDGPRRRVKPWVWLLLALVVVAAGYGAYLLASSWLEVAEVEVPQVEGMAITEAHGTLTAAGLVPQVRERRPDPQVAAQHVIRQIPAAGTVVKKGIEVFLDVSTGVELREVPEVVGLNERDARLRLQNAGLTVAAETRREYRADVPQGQVSAQDPQPRQKVPPATEVTLTVSLGPQPVPVTMPDLRGLRLEDAEAQLTQLGLELGEVKQQPSDQYFKGEVSGQDVPPNDRVLQGHLVNLTVSSGEGPPPRPATVSYPVPNDGQQHLISIMVDDDQGSREAYRQSHQPGERLEETVMFYRKGTIRILDNNQVVYEQKVP